MMHPCPPDEDLGELFAAGADDPRRAHLDACPRCRARLAAFRAFTEMEPHPPGANPEDARAHLRNAMRAVIAEQPVSTRELPRWRLWLGWPSAAGLAALTLLVLLVRVTPEFRAGRDIVLRGTTREAPAPAPLSCTPHPDGSAEFRWPASAPGDRYRVVIFSQSLGEIARWEAGADTSRVVSPAELQTLGAPGAAIFWRVAVIRGDDEVTLSPPATWRLP